MPYGIEFTEKHLTGVYKTKAAERFSALSATIAVTIAWPVCSSGWM
jgi:hypothetical protein